MVRFAGFVLIIPLLFALCACTGIKVKMITMMKGGTPDPLPQPVTVPFTINGPHIITLQANFNDKIAPVILDTGGITMLDSTLCADMSLVCKDYGTNLALAPVHRIALGEVSVTDMKAAVTAFDRNFKMGRFGLHGMIGSDYLRFFQTRIDYDKQTVTFSQPQRIRKQDSHDHLLKMQLIVPCLPTVPVKVDGKYKLRAMVDTGLHYPFVMRYSLLDKLPAKVRQSVVTCDGKFAQWPFTKESRNALAVVSELRIGDIVLHDQTVLFADFPETFGDNVMLLGRGFLQQYVTTLDFRHHQVCFRDAHKILEDIGFGTGLNLAWNGQAYVVKGVWKGSPGDLAGIHVDDCFRWVDGQSGISDQELFQRLYNPDFPQIELTPVDTDTPIVLVKTRFVPPVLSTRQP